MNALNRNIESVNLVGSQFENVYNLWSKFEQVMSVPSVPVDGSPSNPTSPQQPNQAGPSGESNQPLALTGLLSTSVGSGTVVESSIELHDPNLPPGVAPGGGMTTWGLDQS